MKLYYLDHDHPDYARDAGGACAWAPNEVIAAYLLTGVCCHFWAENDYQAPAYMEEITDSKIIAGFVYTCKLGDMQRVFNWKAFQGVSFDNEPLWKGSGMPPEPDGVGPFIVCTGTP